MRPRQGCELGAEQFVHAVFNRLAEEIAALAAEPIMKAARIAAALFADLNLNGDSWE